MENLRTFTLAARVIEWGKTKESFTRKELEKFLDSDSFRAKTIIDFLYYHHCVKRESEVFDTGIPYEHKTKTSYTLPEGTVLSSEYVNSLPGELRTMILSSAIKSEEKSTIVGTRYRYIISKVADREYKDYSYHCLKEIEERIVKAKDKYDKALNDYEVMKNTLFK